MSLPSSFPPPEIRATGNILSSTLQSQVDGTNIVRRRIGTDLTQRSFNLAYIISGEQFDEFLVFFENTINQGFSYFSIPLLDELIVGKIVNGWSASPVGLSWRLTFNFVSVFSFSIDTGEFIPLASIIPAHLSFMVWCDEIAEMQRCTNNLKNLKIITRNLFPPV